MRKSKDMAMLRLEYQDTDEYAAKVMAPQAAPVFITLNP
jgi:hypothetical protein